MNIAGPARPGPCVRAFWTEGATVRSIIRFYPIYPSCSVCMSTLSVSWDASDGLATGNLRGLACGLHLGHIHMMAHVVL